MLASPVLRRTALTVASLLSLLATACGGADEGPGSISLDVDAPAAAVEAGLTAGCQEGNVKSCTIYLGRHGDLSNCVYGLAVCSAGEWSPCIDEETMNDDPELYETLLSDSE